MMEIYRFEKVLALALLCLCSWTSVLAQQSGSAASVSRSRAIVNAGPNTYYPPSPSNPAYNLAPPALRIPEEVAVEEFVNYHKHRLPLPKVGQAVTMDDMNNGLTQVVMAKFRTDSVKSMLPVKVRLSYFDVKRSCMVEEVQDLRLSAAESDSCELLTDVEVKKNYTIAELADSLFQMAGFARSGNYLQAQRNAEFTPR
jgi:hypothetical protein